MSDEAGYVFPADAYHDYDAMTSHKVDPIPPNVSPMRPSDIEQALAEALREAVQWIPPGDPFGEQLERRARAALAALDDTTR